MLWQNLTRDRTRDQTQTRTLSRSTFCNKRKRKRSVAKSEQQRRPQKRLRKLLHKLRKRRKKRDESGRKGGRDAADREGAYRPSMIHRRRIILPHPPLLPGAPLAAVKSAAVTTMSRSNAVDPARSGPPHSVGAAPTSADRIPPSESRIRFLG